MVIQNVSCLNNLQMIHHYSLSTIVLILIVGIGKKSYGFMNFRTLKTSFTIDFTRKNTWNAFLLL